LCHIIIKAEAYKAKNSLTQCFNCQKFGHISENANNPLDICGVGAVTYIRSALELINRRTSYQTVATGNQKMESSPTPPTTVSSATQQRSRNAGECRDLASGD
jgi:hypothetical protein